MQAWQKTLAAMWVAMFFIFLEFTFSIAFLPIFLQEEFGLSFQGAASWMGFLAAMPSVVMFLGQPAAGIIADRIGRKPVVLFSVVATSLCRALWYFARSPVEILALGIAAGLLGSGGVASSAIVASQAPRGKLGSVLGLFQTSWTLGFVVGPLAGAFLSEHVGYRNTFLAQAVFAAVGGAVIWAWVKEDHTGRELAPVGRLRDMLLRDLRPLASSRNMLVLWMAMFTMTFGFALIIPLFTLFVQYLGVRIESVPVVAGTMMFLVGLVQSVLAPVFGRLSDRVGHRRVLVASAYAVGVLIAPQAFVANVWQFLGLRILSTASGAAMMPATNALVATFMPARQYGGAYGVLGSSRTLAFAIAPIVGGIVAAQFGIRVTFILCAALSLIAATWVQYGLGKGPEEGLVEDEAEADLLPPSEALGTDSGADG